MGQWDLCIVLVCISEDMSCHCSLCISGDMSCHCMDQWDLVLSLYVSVGV
jgi:hypothetical protein